LGLASLISIDIGATRFTNRAPTGFPPQQPAAQLCQQAPTNFPPPPPKKEPANHLPPPKKSTPPPSFANKHRGFYHSSCAPSAFNFYNSKSYNDDLAWAAIWLYKATGSSYYLDQAKQ
jgi:hypothetical protein